jgi:hypothetical protein
MHFSIWSACERLGILPPNVKRRWDDNDAWTQAQILAYDQVQDHDENEGASANPFAAKRK